MRRSELRQRVLMMLRLSGVWHARGTNAPDSVKIPQWFTSLDPRDSRGDRVGLILTMTEYGSCPYSKATRGNIDVEITVSDD